MEIALIAIAAYFLLSKNGTTPLNAGTAAGTAATGLSALQAAAVAAAQKQAATQAAAQAAAAKTSSSGGGASGGGSGGGASGAGTSGGGSTQLQQALSYAQLVQQGYVPGGAPIDTSTIAGYNQTDQATIAEQQGPAAVNGYSQTNPTAFYDIGSNGTQIDTSSTQDQSLSDMIATPVSTQATYDQPAVPYYPADTTPGMTDAQLGASGIQPNPPDPTYNEYTGPTDSGMGGYSDPSGGGDYSGFDSSDPGWDG